MPDNRITHHRNTKINKTPLPKKEKIKEETSFPQETVELSQTENPLDIPEEIEEKTIATVEEANSQKNRNYLREVAEWHKFSGMPDENITEGGTYYRKYNDYFIRPIDLSGRKEKKHYEAVSINSPNHERIKDESASYKKMKAKTPEENPLDISEKIEEETIAIVEKASRKNKHYLREVTEWEKLSGLADENITAKTQEETTPLLQENLEPLLENPLNIPQEIEEQTIKIIEKANRQNKHYLHDIIEWHKLSGMPDENITEGGTYYRKYNRYSIHPIDLSGRKEKKHYKGIMVNSATHEQILKEQRKHMLSDNKMKILVKKVDQLHQHCLDQILDLCPTVFGLKADNFGQAMEMLKTASSEQKSSPAMKLLRKYALITAVSKTDNSTFHNEENINDYLGRIKQQLTELDNKKNSL